MGFPGAGEMAPSRLSPHTHSPLSSSAPYSRQDISSRPQGLWPQRRGRRSPQCLHGSRVEDGGSSASSWVPWLRHIRILPSEYSLMRDVLLFPAEYNWQEYGERQVVPHGLTDIEAPLFAPGFCTDVFFLTYSVSNCFPVACACECPVWR